MSTYSLLKTFFNQRDGLNPHNVLLNATEEVLKSFDNNNDSHLQELKFLHLVVEFILNTCSADKNKATESDLITKKHFQEPFRTIVDDVCLRILREVTVGNNAGEKREELEAACELLSLCLRTLHVEETLRLLTMCITTFREYVCSLTGGGEVDEKALSPVTAVELSKYLLDNIVKSALQENRDIKTGILSLEESIFLILQCCDEKLAALILAVVVPKFMEVVSECGKLSLRETLWKCTQNFFLYTYQDCVSDNVGVGYLILCNIVDNLQTWSRNSDESLKVFCESNYFWKIIQSGLVHQNPLNRKRALFVLKKVLLELGNSSSSIKCTLFWWHQDEKEKLIELWSNYLLIMEALEERQVHVIKPVLPKVEFLVSAAKSRTAFSGSWYLRCSWVTTVYHRMFLHESKFMKQMGVMKTLRYDFSKEELLDQDQTQFILYPLLFALNDPSLYIRSATEVRGLCPTLAEALIGFLRGCNETLESVEHQAQFLSSFLQQMQLQTWCSVSLLYVSQALASLPPTRVWKSNSLNDLRPLVSSVLTTQEVFLRGSIQCFLLEALLILIDVEDVSFTAFCDILAPFRNEESLRRGNGLWKRVTDWVKSTVGESSEEWTCPLTKKAAFCFVQSVLDNILYAKKNSQDAFLLDSAVVEKSARLLILFMDAEIVEVLNDESCMGLCTLFQPMTELLTTMNSRPYLSISTVDHSLQLIVAMLEELQNSDGNEYCVDSKRKSIYIWLESCVEDIIRFVIERIPTIILQMQDLNRLELYLRLLEMLSMIKLYHPIILKYTNSFAEVCCDVFTLAEHKEHNASAMQFYAAAKGLSWIVDLLVYHLLEASKQELASAILNITQYVQRRLDSYTLSEPLKKEDDSSGGDRFQKSRWGRIVSEYISCSWKCLSFCLMISPEMTDCVSVAQQALQAMELSADVLPAIGSCMKLLLPQLLERDECLFREMLESMWKVCFEKRKTEAFWLGMKAFVQMTFQPILLNHKNAQILKEYSNRAFELSDSSPNIFRILVFHCFDVWIKDDKPSFHQHLQLLVNTLLFGPVHRKDQRATNEAAAYISSLGEKVSVNNLLESNHLDDTMVRVAGLTLVLRLSCDREENQQLVSDLLDLLLEEDIKATSSRARYFGNSLIHRVKNRVWQTILILEPLLSEEKLTTLLPIVYAELVKEGAQPSVRLCQEWLAVLIMLRIPSLRKNIWLDMQEASDTRVGSVGSFLAIVSHLGKVVESEEQEEFIMAAVPHVLPWCMAQNFNTRVTAQVAFHQLWHIAEEKNLRSVISAYGSVQACVNFTVDSRNATKNTHKLLEDFYYGVFNCVNHYSLETIFYEFPRILQLTDEEWIPPSLFVQKAPKVEKAFAVPIFNSDNALASCEPAAWMMKVVISDEMENEGSAKISGNVQKKLIPWKQLIAEQGFSFDTINRTQNREGLIVVASLIDRPPNLGGLCRTCEIFGASEYVLGSLKYTEDKQFQNLSVSAEKWIPITEVKCHQIREYLLSMRKKGYILVGAEQTAYSKQLHNFQFPKKTLLLLGNEKEGIPVEFIQLLDICLEIPQYGVIRSLNVHVSGAVIIWEYAKQHQLKQI